MEPRKAHSPPRAGFSFFSYSALLHSATMENGIANNPHLLSLALPKERWSVARLNFRKTTRIDARFHSPSVEEGCIDCLAPARVDSHHLSPVLASSKKSDMIWHNISLRSSQWDKQSSFAEEQSARRKSGKIRKKSLRRIQS